MVTGGIAKITIDDFEEVADLCFSHWSDFKEWLTREELNNSFLLKSPDTCLKFTRDGKIVGVVLALEKMYVDNYPAIYVRLIIVSERSRRGDIGRALLKVVEQAGRDSGCQSVWLDSGERDYAKGAFLFYQKLGYKVVGHARVHNDNLLFFEKQLKASG